MIVKRNEILKSQLRNVSGWHLCAISAMTLMLLFLPHTSPHQPFAAEQNRYLAGQLLVATPEMGDPRFVETVIYMVKHDQHGAMGLIINRPLAKGPIADLLKALGADSEGAQGEIILHYGGPVEPEDAFILHSDDQLMDTTKVVGEGIAFTADLELLRAIALGKGPKRNLFILGYAGWATGQLEAEIEANGWFTIPADKELIFGPNPETKWNRALDRRKIPL